MKQLAGAINKVMWDVNGIWKWLTVGKGNNSYKWVSAAELYDSIRKSMIEHWLSILQWPIESTIKIDRWEEVDAWSKEVPKAMKTKQSVFTEVTSQYILLHTSWESQMLWGYWQGVDTQDKGAGKATTYALKNTLINTFLIPTWDIYDTDSTHSNDIEVPQTPQVKKAKFTDEIFAKFKENDNFKDYFEAKVVIDKKYELWPAMAKVVKLYYETKDVWVQLKEDWTPPF